MTLRIIAAAVKRPAPVRTPQDQFAAAVGLGTFNTTGDRFRILACRIIRTTQKLTLTTPLDDHELPAKAAALSPFLEHDDGNRALMGANMQRQAVPLFVVLQGLDDPHNIGAIIRTPSEFPFLFLF